jgi:hypothetical protein
MAICTIAKVRWIAGPPDATTCWFHWVTTSAFAVVAVRRALANARASLDVLNDEALMGSSCGS